MDPVYLDYNATSTIDPEVADFMIPVLKETFGNPSSNHKFGFESRKIIEDAREQTALLLNCHPEEIVFTSGGTESNNFALIGAALAGRDRGRHIITSNIEHPAVTEVCHYLSRNGFDITWLPVNSEGIIEPEILEKAIRKDTILISIMHANNETGTLEPIAELADIAHRNNILFHTDAAQSAGKIEVDTRILGVDLLSLAGHKFHAPKGVGALFIKKGVSISRILHGADHENNLRPGTENVLEIAGLGKAAQIAKRDLKKNNEIMNRTRDLLFNLLKENLPDIRRNGHPYLTLPNTLNVSFPGIDAVSLMSEMTDVAVSAGAACHAEQTSVSHVLKAMGLSDEQALTTIRFSTGKFTSEDDIRKAAGSIIQKVKILRGTNEIPLKGSSCKLTQFTHGLGCACKISPAILEQVLKSFPATIHPDILVGTETSDDAAVYRINKDTAVVQTVDFFTPVLDDPFMFGAVAAANALSDVYAMGARPLFGLNIVAFPTNRLSLEVLQQILAGARSVADEAGISIIGGHTIEDNEPKFGMVITGTVHPDAVIRNHTSKPGDELILTKPLGTGILSTAMKRDQLDPQTSTLLYNTMRRLNKTDAEIMQKYTVSACTDISGFGLLGHLKEMLTPSGLSATLNSSLIPILDGARELAARGMIPGGTKNNLDYCSEFVTFSEKVTRVERLIFADAQTSGGLLISVESASAEGLLEEIRSSGNLSAARIGTVLKGKNIRINISA